MIQMARDAVPLLLLTLVACSTGNDHGHDHSNEHDHGGSNAHDAIDRHAEENSTSVTWWSQHHELFVEFGQPEPGHGRPFAAHITQLTDNKQVTEGVLTMALVENGSALASVKVDKAGRNGLFRGYLSSPSEAQNLELRLRFAQETRNSEWIVDADVLNQEDSARAAKITFRKEEQWQVPFQTGYPTVQSIAKPITLPARVEADPRRQSNLLASTDGTVQWGDFLPVVGAHVQKGEHLGWIIPQASDEHWTEISADYQDAQVQLELAQANHQRVVALVANGHLADVVQSESEAALVAATSQHEAAKRRHEQLLGRTGQRVSLIAPRTGVLVAVPKEHGVQVQRGESILTVANLERLLVHGTLVDTHDANLKHLAWATVQSGRWERPLDLTELSGTVLTEELVVDQTSLSAPVVVAIESRNALRVGDVVELTLGIDNDVQQLVIPKTAVVDLNTRTYVFVQTGAESFERRIVTLGVSDSTHVAIESGISQHDRIVMAGGLDVHFASMRGNVETHRH